MEKGSNKYSVLALGQKTALTDLILLFTKLGKLAFSAVARDCINTLHVDTVEQTQPSPLTVWPRQPGYGEWDQWLCHVTGHSNCTLTCTYKEATQFSSSWYNEYGAQGQGHGGKTCFRRYCFINMAASVSMHAHTQGCSLLPPQHAVWDMVGWEDLHFPS